MTTMNDLASARKVLTGMVPPTPVLCAVSGGLDSMCLLHLAAEMGLCVTAAHFHHQLRENADRDEAFVRDWCAKHDIPFVSGRGNVRKAAEQGLSTEEAARELRYAFLLEQQKKLNCTFLLTAHHADDNAETMLLNLLRGTGLRGLTGIPGTRGCITRPFLQVTRTELEAYAKEHNIPHVEDETNALDDAARNVLRHQVLPVLRELNPRAVENMARTAQLLAADERVLEIETGKLLNQCRVEPGYGAEVPAEACQAWPKPIVNRAVWSLLISVGGHRKDLTAALVEAAAALLWKEPGKEVSLPYGLTASRTQTALAIRRSGGLKPVELSPDRSAEWGEYTLTLLDCPVGEGLALCPGGTITAAPCRPAERMTLPGAKGSRSVKRLCLDRHISLAEREKLPAIYVDGRLAAVWRLGVDVEFLPEGKACRFIQIIKHIEENDHEK